MLLYTMYHYTLDNKHNNKKGFYYLADEGRNTKNLTNYLQNIAIVSYFITQLFIYYSSIMFSNFIKNHNDNAYSNKQK